MFVSQMFCFDARVTALRGWCKIHETKEKIWIEKITICLPKTFVSWLFPKKGPNPVKYASTFCACFCYMQVVKIRLVSFWEWRKNKPKNVWSTEVVIACVGIRVKARITGHTGPKLLVKSIHSYWISLKLQIF